MDLKFENGKWKLENVIVKISDCIAYSEGNGLIIKNLDQETLTFFDDLKKDLVHKVYSLGIKKSTMICLEEFYCNPIKNGGNFLKINKGDIPFDSIIDVDVFISGLWFGDKSWGPYLTVMLSKNSGPLFIEDSDSGPDI